MICRSVRPKVLRDLRRLKSGARHSATATDAYLRRVASLQEKPEATPVEPIPEPAENALDFKNSKEIFSSLSTGRLLRSMAILKASSIGAVADLGSFVFNKHELHKKPLLRPVVLGFTERTFYNHFCAGKDFEAANATAAKLWQSGISAMLDYGLEGANDNVSCDRNTEMFINTIDSTRKSGNSEVSFVVVKITAICPKHILKRVSDLLRWEYNHTSMKLPWKLNSLPILCDSSPFYHTPEEPAPLSPEEELDLELAYDRLHRICQKSLDANLPLLFDAEETEIQPAIDYFTYSAVVNYGSERPLIFNTVQAYLKDSPERLTNAVEAAEKMGIPLGIKLVRGAYMNKEKEEAAKLKACHPIHASIDDTHACYDRCAEYLLQKIAIGSVSAVIATHNPDSGRKAALKAINLGIYRRSHCLYFAQLYGMAESLSLGLTIEGYNVSKYLPFGPVEHIIPYLLRRAEENNSMLGASSKDISLMRQEIIRRLTSPGS